MVTRACISINNRCNLNCTYCHFHEKKDYIQEDNMDVITILDIITSHIEDNDIDLFKLGFVGNGEPMLDYEKLKQYIVHIGDYLKSGRIAAYTISHGLLVDREKLEFFKEYNVNVGFSVDGISAIHDKYRCGTHERVMANISLYKEVNGKYPSMNCTVGKEIIDNPEETISFFEQFGNRITFSRMIGKQGISLPDFNAFLNKAMERLNVRTGGYDCTMYGGMCGAGMDNIFYASRISCIWLTEIKPLLLKIHIGSVVMARQRSSMEIFILAINRFFLKRNYKPRLLTNLKLQR